MHLQRTLTPLETWGFGLTALINWITIAPLLQAAIGPSAIFVWLPGIFIGMMLNLQVKRLGEHFPNLAGGTPNYTIRLLKSYPVLGRYAASGYFLSWVATLPISALVLTQLIQQNLVDLGFSCPKIFLNIGFTILPLILAFSGTRALSILHAFFVLPTLAVLLIFSIQGLFWLATSPNSPGFFPSTWPSLSLFEWAKWFYLATYTFYGCDSAACFIADSRNPAKTLQFLKIAAWLMPPVIIGGAWVLLRGSDEPSLGNDLFLNLLAASKPFWGSAAFLLVTFLLAASALLSCATVVANCPRMLYQLAVDKEFPPVFGVVSRRGVFGPGLVLVLLLSLICLAWGNVPRIVAITNVGWVASLTIFHLGLWLQRGKAEVRWPCWSGGFFVVDAIVLVVGGLAWGWQDFTIGLLFPITLLIGDGAMRHIEFAPFHPAWWIKRYRRRTQNQNSSNFVAFQVVILIFLVASAVAIGWYFGSIFTAKSSTSANLLAVLLLCVTFVSVAIACWTSLPKVLAMNEAREFAEQLFIIALDAILVLDEVGVVFQANPAAERLFDTQVKNLHTNSLLGCHLSKLLPGLGNDPQQWSSRSEQILNLRARSLHIVEVAISNRFFQSASINDWQPQEYVVIVRDITERKQAEAIALRAAVAEATNQKLEQEIVQRQRVEAQLLHNAFHDVLTDLPNRALFLKQLQRALVRAGQQRNYRFAVLFLDLERFKLINDSLGHMLGDELLISIAQRWSSCLDQKDTIARLGGDEFVILLEDIQNYSDATNIAQRLQNALASPFYLEGHEVFISASIGIVLSWGINSATYSCERPEELLRDADTAMYRAKVQGRSRYEVFDIAMHNQVVMRLQLETDLQRAIERQEFVLLYQPIVSLKTGSITGFEALIRWIHPQRGLICPDLFIPIAEETGLIVSIGHWVLDEACRQISRWQTQFSNRTALTISVNLSVKQFAWPNLVNEIAQSLHQFNLNPRCLKLEITESVLMENAELVTTVMQQLKSLGVVLCLDDFGTGYSSLSYLHRFPVEILKIDRSFVSHMSFGNENFKIVQAITTLAQSLSIDVIAEGIETVEQQAQLSRLQCQYGQGYLFSKPLERNTADTLIAQQLAQTNNTSI